MIGCASILKPIFPLRCFYCDFLFSISPELSSLQTSMSILKQSKRIKQITFSYRKQINKKEKCSFSFFIVYFQSSNMNCCISKILPTYLLDKAHRDKKVKFFCNMCSPHQFLNLKAPLKTTYLGSHKQVEPNNRTTDLNWEKQLSCISIKQKHDK